MSQSSTLYVGIDVQKESSAIASVAQEHGAEVIPTVSLDVISLVASSCGRYRGQIEHRAAYACAVLVATQRARAKRHCQVNAKTCTSVQ
jgi:hypothetical protein